MTKQEIITKFELFMDDTTELSSQEESDLFDKWYKIILNDRPWEILKKAATGTLSTTVPYVTLPTDFSYLVANANVTAQNEEASLPVVYVINGTNYIPYKVVSWSDRRSYTNQDGYCYVDITTGRLYFTKQPVSAYTYEFDYKASPTVLSSLSNSPIFPSDYHDILYHAMCADDFIVQQSDKAKSYKLENEERYVHLLKQLQYWNANLIQQ